MPSRATTRSAASTVTAPDVTLNLDSGTLDLSGSGTLGTFQAESPGDVVNLIGGVLKSASVTSGTTITVPPSRRRREHGVVDGGVLNGTLQALDGSTLDLEGSWTNNGTITAATGSTLILGDYWNAAASDPGATSDAWVNHGTITADERHRRAGRLAHRHPQQPRLARPGHRHGGADRHAGQPASNAGAGAGRNQQHR